MDDVKIVIFALIAILGITGCGLTKDEDSASANDDQVKDNFTPNGTNCVDNIENAFGCYGATKTLANRKVIEGVWSVYTVSTMPVANQSIYYDTYKLGYQFLSDGTAFKHDATATYSKILTWGVDPTGKEITISNDGTYKIDTQFFNDLNCFKATNSQIGEDIKICNESVLSTGTQNSAGYYGNTVRYGNYSHGNILAVGTWSITKTGQINSVKVTLDSNGTTSNGAQWGISPDGKRITIDDKSYLAYKYPESLECITSFELSGDIILPQTWELCKVN